MFFGVLKSDAFSGDKTRNLGLVIEGAVEFVLGALLFIAGPAAIYVLRRTPLWLLLTVAAIAYVAYVVWILGFPPNSDWTAY